MDDTLFKLAYVLVPLILGGAGFVIRSYITRLSDRLDMLERQMIEKISRPEAKELLSDKVEPIRQDIQELKAKVDKIYDIILDNKLNGNKS